MNFDLPEWLDHLEHGPLREELEAARYARVRSVRHGALKRAPALLKAGDALLVEAEQLAEQGQHEAVAKRRARSAGSRYERANHESLDVSDGNCVECRKKLKPAFEEYVEGSGKDRLIIRQPEMWRCDPCGATYGDQRIVRFAREDGETEVGLFTRRWMDVDK